MSHVGIDPVFLKLGDDLAVEHGSISSEQLFGLPPLAENLFFSFESLYTPYTVYATGKCPTVDLVTIDTSTATGISTLEIKLTALPDNTTCMLDESNYGCELVIRPQTIGYLAFSLALNYAEDREELVAQFEPIIHLISDVDWSDAIKMRPLIPALVSVLDNILLARNSYQSPFLLQPVWKTKGKSPILAEQCLDAFVWSNHAITRLFVDTALNNSSRTNVTRNERTVVWLIKMLYDFARRGKINYEATIDRITYNVKNDKAFAVSGKVTHKYMASSELTRPRLSKDAFKEIILGGGQDYLSPERRLDAVILNTLGLFG